MAAPRPPQPGGGWRHDWAHGAVFYQLFVRSFADSNGDGVGDLAGLTARLDYLNDGDPATASDLGVDALWLMPIFESPSYHGYDTVDYERIDAEYGSLQEFERFLAEAHRRGLRVIVDFVVNHSGRGHPWFAEASSSPGAARRDWYVWREDDPAWTQPWGGTYRTWHPLGDAFYYGVFWGGMPDLNWRSAAVRGELLRLADLWLGRGVDGFRLDATRHLVENGPDQAQVDQPETHRFLKEFAAGVRARHPEAVLVGENWTSTDKIAPYFGSTAALPSGDELPMNFNFPLAEALIAAARGGDARPIGGVLDVMAALYPPGVLDAPFLANHDQRRLTSQLDGDLDAQRVAAAALLTLPGAPFLYYGEEIGLENGPARGDEAKRTPMPWTAAAPGHGFTEAPAPWHPFSGDPQRRNVAALASDPSSLWAHYRRLIALRRATPALREGDLQRLGSDLASGALSFVRRRGDSAVLVAINFGREERSLAWPVSCGAISELLAAPAAPALTRQESTCLLQLPGQSFFVARRESPTG